MTLQEIVVLLEEGRLGAAVPPLLEAWRTTPDPRLAAALDGLASRIPRPAITTKTERTTIEALLAGGGRIEAAVERA